MRRILFYCLIILLAGKLHAQYGWYIQNSGTNVKLNSVSIVYPYSHVWVAGDNGTILMTSNTGANWIQQPSGTNNNLNSIQFVNPLRGFAAGNNGTILHTTDGGVTWISSNSGTIQDLLAVCFDYYVWSDSAYSLYALGKNGTILRTTNYGQSWIAQSGGTSNDLHEFYPFDWGSGWIAGSGGTILKTVNSGANWVPVTSGTSQQLNSIQSIYQNGNMFGAIATGNNGTIVRSNTNGITWFPIASGTANNLNRMSYQYLNNIWTAGNNGTLLKSSDIGASWFPEILPSNVNFNSVRFYDFNNGWVVGDNGIIIHTASDNWYIDSRIMDANNISTWFTNNGTFNNSITNGVNAGFEWPKNQNHFARFSSGLWISGANGSDTSITIAQYGNFQYVPGYTDNNGIEHGSNDRDYRMYELHYGVNDSDRTKWPNALLGNSDQGAPVYFDTSSNSWKPLDFGDQTMYYCYSDNNVSVHLDFTSPLKADVKQLNYAFTNGPEALTNTIICRYAIINRNTTAWNGSYITIWTDDDLGNPADDKTGCDTTLGLGYTYNGTNSDTAYGNAPPAVGFLLLRGPVVFTGNNSDTAFICNGRIKTARLKYKQLGMSVFNIYANGADPLVPTDYLHYMEGLDINGNSIINPVTGKQTKFVFSGDPETNTGWVQNNMTDMRFLISVGPVNINPGDTQVIVVAQLIAKGTSNVNSVTKLKQYAQVIKNLYNDCFTNVPIGISKNSEQVPIKFALYQNYPNPFNPVTKIKFDVPSNVKSETTNVKLVIFDILGREVTTLLDKKLQPGSYKTVWDGSNFASGVYFYKLSVGNEQGEPVFSETKKMILIK